MHMKLSKFFLGLFFWGGIFTPQLEKLFGGGKFYMGGGIITPLPPPLGRPCSCYKMGEIAPQF